MTKEFEKALDEYKADIREAYNFGFDEETNAVNLAVKAAHFGRDYGRKEILESEELKAVREALDTTRHSAWATKAVREKAEHALAKLDQLRKDVCGHE